MSKPLGVAGKAVIRKNGKIILIKRAQRSSFEPGLWELPGGKVDYGENLVEALKREVEEEVGLLIDVGKPIITWHFLKEPYWVTGVTFLADCRGGTVGLSKEHDEYAWINPRDYAGYPLSRTVKEQVEAYLELL